MDPVHPFTFSYVPPRVPDRERKGSVPDGSHQPPAPLGASTSLTCIDAQAQLEDLLRTRDAAKAAAQRLQVSDRLGPAPDAPRDASLSGLLGRGAARFVAACAFADGPDDVEVRVRGIRAVPDLVRAGAGALPQVTTFSAAAAVGRFLLTDVPAFAKAARHRSQSLKPGERPALIEQLSGYQSKKGLYAARCLSELRAMPDALARLVGEYVDVADDLPGSPVIADLLRAESATAVPDSSTPAAPGAPDGLRGPEEQ